jgi:ornithine cyclodeaminase
MAEVIEAMKRAFSALSAGRAQVPLRSRLHVPVYDSVSLFMPAYVQQEGLEALAVKAVTVNPQNPARDLPVIHAAVLVFDPQSGRLQALLEGGNLTAIRTGAASGAATDVLAREDCQVAAIFGAGVQARTQLEAVCTVREVQQAWIYDPTPSRAESLIEELAGRGSIPSDLRAARTPAQAARDADVICAATTSATPVFQDQDLKPGVHINGVGSYTPEMQEIPAETVIRARVVVDSRSAVLAEAGDLIVPLAGGAISSDHVHVELGDVIAGRAPGREDRDQITFFKSVGVAVQDAAAADLALKNALRLGLGQEVDW